jgi:natural product biosynthesis luciferase-like monooxygenase protein
MRFGVHYLPTYMPEYDGPVADYYRHVFEQVALAESLGYDDIWITEHHFHEFGGIVPDPAAFLSSLAVRTSRIHLGIAIVVLPLHNPIRTAEAYAMVDNLSGGRLEFGVARGSAPREFQQSGVSYEESGRRLKEAMEVVQQAWTQERLDFQGDLFQFSGQRVLPRPAQKPHPPVWVAASRSDDTYRWAGSKGFNLMVLPNAAPPPALQAAVGSYREALRISGHGPEAEGASRARPAGETEVLAKFVTYVAESDAAARREAGPFLANYHRVAEAGNPAGPGRGGDTGLENQLAKRVVCVGDPEHCVDIIRGWTETLGLTTFSGQFYFGGMPHETALKSLRLFAEKVIPALR